MRKTALKEAVGKKRWISLHPPPPLSSTGLLYMSILNYRVYFFICVWKKKLTWSESLHKLKENPVCFSDSSSLAPEPPHNTRGRTQVITELSCRCTAKAWRRAECFHRRRSSDPPFEGDGEQRRLQGGCEILLSVLFLLQPSDLIRIFQFGCSLLISIFYCCVFHLYFLAAVSCWNPGGINNCQSLQHRKMCFCFQNDCDKTSKYQYIGYWWGFSLHSVLVLCCQSSYRPHICFLKRHEPSECRCSPHSLQTSGCLCSRTPN